MNKRFLVILLPLLLASCDLTSGNSQQQSSGNTEQTSQTETEDEKQEQESQQEHQEEQHEEQHQEEQTGGEGDNPTPVVDPVTDYLSLDEWHNYTFNDGTHPCYDDDWDFYYGTSHKPAGPLWENPDYKEYSGIEFEDKKQELTSPKFNTYPKVEIRFYFWFSSHTSKNFKATDGEPQFKIEEYDKNNKLLYTDTISIARSDVPTNNRPKEIKKYLYQPNMVYFKLKFNNFIPNGTSGYTAVLTSVGLKGWPQA